MSSISGLRRIFWPIESYENKKFIPMASMMFCILFNYSVLRSIKDSFVVVGIGAEAISFLKMYVVLPMAVVAMIVYSKLCNSMSQKNVFYTIATFFISYLVLFAFVLYPYQEFIHLSSETIENWVEALPRLKWFIRIIGKWSFVSFYVIAELWGSIMLSLLFWQFANKITKTDEAKRFYSMFGMLGNIGLILAGGILQYRFSDPTLNTQFRIVASIISGVMIIGIYYWINKNVLTDPKLYSPDSAGGKTKKSKPKLSIGESLKLIFSSKYLGFIAILIFSYGVAVNLVEGVWKAKAKELYPSMEQYQHFMGYFQQLQGIGAIVFMIIGSNILRRVSWRTAALFTPMMILVTSIIFFGCIIFNNEVSLYLAAFFTGGPLALAVSIGTWQNVLSKATKYSLFDSTKEMSYIPLDRELQTKGKAAVDVVGGRFGKSGGAAIQSTFFMLMPALTFNDAIPYFSVFFFIIVICWIGAVFSLSTLYEEKLQESNQN